LTFKLCPLATIAVTVVEENDALRAAAEEMIRSAQGYELNGSFGDAEEATILIPFMKPDVVLLNIDGVNGHAGLECIRNLRPFHPEIAFIVCTAQDDDEKIFEALCAGAGGYMLRRSSPAELLRAIREVHEGGAPMSGGVARKVVSVFQVNDSGGEGWNPLHARRGKSLPSLSNRENEILQHLAAGLLYKEIAAQLFISPETVRKHVYHIYEKLQVGNRVEAINKFFRRS